MISVFSLFINSNQPFPCFKSVYFPEEFKQLNCFFIVFLGDYVINNEGSLEETRKQVEDLWEELKKFQAEKRQKTS